MDITYLLWLQDFRNSIHDAWTPFMESASLFAITYLVLLPVFVYWCIHKRKGLFTLGALYFCMASNVLVKLTACVYRPWIRDVRILPAGDSIKTATGYSFPSGHTAIGTAIYGGLALSCWKNNKLKWFVVLCIIAILITGFSRNYLGVHTPQDVLVGLLLGAFSLWFTWKVFGYVDKHPEQENKVLLAIIIASVAALVYVSYKPYPTDYVNGKLLVDPKKMMNDGFSNFGALIGFCVARFIEKQWIKFKPTGLTVKGIILALIGFAPLVWMINKFSPLMIGWTGPHMGRFLAQFLMVFYIVAFYPFILKCFCGTHKNA